MGTTLHAIIEEFSPESEFTHSDGTKDRTRACWFEMGTWEFGKAYELMVYLDGAKNGWPADSESISDPNLDLVADTGRQWCDVPFLERALKALEGKKEEVPWVTDALEALLAALHVMVAKGAVLRVLWYRM